MIEVKFYYQHRITKKWLVGYKSFNNVNSAIRFMYKCKNSPTMLCYGECTCDDPEDLEEINRRFH